MTTGQGLFRDDNLMLMHREGYVEECYFSYTLSPIFEADGSVNGVFNAVQETTQRILATRRLKTLGELGNRTPGKHEIVTLSNGDKAILLPVATSTGKNVLTSVMICGINPRRALDREYMGFLQLVVGHVSSSMTHADLGKRMSMSSIDDEKKKYQFPFDDISNQTFANHEIMAYAAADPNEQNMKGLKFQYTYGGDIQAEAEAAAAASSESIKPLLEHIIKDSLDYSRETDVTVVLKVSLEELDGESSTSDENVKKGKLCVEVIDSGIGVERVNHFSSCEESITAVKAWREQYNNEALYDIVFFNVRENNSEEIKNAAKELRRICDDNLCIVLIVFWSANGRALGQNLVQEIGGKTCIICKPVMQKRLLHCLFSKDFVSEPYAPSIQNEYYSSVKPLADLRIEDFYRNNRPPFSEEKDLTAKDSSSAEKNPMIETSEETAKSNVERMESDDLPKVYVPAESSIKGKGKSVEPTQLGVKRTANDEAGNTSASNDDRASKFRFRPVSKSKCILCVIKKRNRSLFRKPVDLKTGEMQKGWTSRSIACIAKKQ
ncbi:21929_t:CDS:2 [Dentiscutata erythropus]|uniref:21929_t:CDS:1 n=1 Tax=Dentiscutata erythropus TaxID=1348616 RepID=A0A9N8ZE27_9GLOM|nr:21929_t:CDS:2 [Dentiscutata erythropus]